mmetsp:Transcript_23597/g.53675  ORF Transcript_23597/g.53675 Transcript_23597/m.53675 type:complete len:218 (-) Transcript_23597:295-948(-)
MRRRRTMGVMIFSASTRGHQKPSSSSKIALTPPSPSVSSSSASSPRFFLKSCWAYSGRSTMYLSSALSRSILPISRTWPAIRGQSGGDQGGDQGQSDRGSLITCEAVIASRFRVWPADGVGFSRGVDGVCWLCRGAHEEAARNGKRARKRCAETVRISGLRTGAFDSTLAPPPSAAACTARACSFRCFASAFAARSAVIFAFRATSSGVEHVQSLQM